MQLKANCKINLGLNVLCRRSDGYHDLETVMLPVKELYDIVTVERSEGGDVSFSASGIAVDCASEDNLCVRAARLMQERYGVGGLSIHLDKRVPFGAGLGGGSSDATAVVKAINELFALNLSSRELVDVAASLGSDTAYFVYNDTELCCGRGEVMQPIELSLEGLWLVVVKPDEGVSTAEAYRGVTPHIPERGLQELLGEPIASWQGSVKNDFEPHIFASHPAIRSIKESLIAIGALYASMSGSGSALFALFDHRPELSFAEELFVHIERL